MISWTMDVKRQVSHKTDHLFAVEEVSTGTGPGIVKTFFYNNIKSNCDYIIISCEMARERGSTGPAF